jgi:hypothetical protein
LSSVSSEAGRRAEFESLFVLLSRDARALPPGAGRRAPALADRRRGACRRIDTHSPGTAARGRALRPDTAHR